MIRYVPFLKAKRGELTAMRELTPNVKEAICPFFDFPRKKSNYSLEAYLNTTQSIATSLRKHWGSSSEFYFDDFDIEQCPTVNGEHPYASALMALGDLKVVPVVGLGRTSHNAAVANLKHRREIASSCVAFRVEQRDFEDFDDCYAQINSDMMSVFGQFETIDLILDCRLCINSNVKEAARQVAAYSRRFCNALAKTRRVIVTGSSLPASIGDVLSVDSTIVVPRHELGIISGARALTDVELICGDYATVSPFYSDVELDPKIMPNVMTPRLVYSFRRSHYIARGVSLKSGGYSQYIGLTAALCGQTFFRAGFSSGENYFLAKSQGMGTNATNGTVVKPSVVAHVTYMVLCSVL